MKRVTKNIQKLPKEVIELIKDTESTPYLEQLRVKEYEKQIPQLKGEEIAIIPWSAGLDSTTSLLMALESSIKVKTVFFDYGQEYVDKERDSIEKILSIIENSTYSDQIIEHVELDISWLSSQMSELFPGDWAHIFPMRNFIILYLSVDLFEDEYKSLWFSPVQGEIPFSGGDKSKVFIRYMEEYMITRFNTPLRLPLINLSKGDLVHWGKRDDFRMKVIMKTISCFELSTEKQCGKCQACFNRAVAFNSVDSIGQSGINLQSAEFEKFINLYKKKLLKNDYYSNRRREEFTKFINDYNGS